MSLKDELLAGLKKAAFVADGKSNLGKVVGLTPNAISGWFMRGMVPHDYVIPLVRIFPDKLTPHDLRPDLYPSDIVGSARLTRDSLARIVSNIILSPGNGHKYDEAMARTLNDEAA